MVILAYVLFFVILAFMHLSRKYQNNNKLIFNAGKKGCGKSTDICKCSMKDRSRGRTVFTTERIPDTYYIDPEDIGGYEFPENSVIYIDEVGLVWHARDFKTFSKEVREWFKLQRHRKLTVHMYSQCFDIDKGLRDLCDEIWIVKSYFNLFSVKKKVLKDLTIVEAGPESESRFADNLRIVPAIVPGSRKITYLPRYHKYFDSFAAPELKKKEFELVPVTRIYSKPHFRVQLRLMRMELGAIARLQHTKYLTFRYKNGLIKRL